MLHIGCHLSGAKGYLSMGKVALSLGANTFQFFTRNPRGGAVKPMDEADAAALAAFLHAHHFAPPLAHAPYTYNPCAAKEALRAFALSSMREDLQRLEFLPGALYNLHPGAHVGQGVDVGIARTAEVLDALLETPFKTPVLLETMSGKGSEVGSTFEELAQIIHACKHGDRLGVCLDTCHVYDAGYDLVNDLDGVLAHFDRVVGLKRLKAVHLNDSKNPFASHKDRHERIGEGMMGLACFERLMHHPALRGLPFYLETPNELSGYADEIALLRRLYDH